MRLEDLSQLPTLEPTSLGFFQITDFKDSRISLIKPHQPVFVDQADSGRVQISDEYTNVVVVGKFPEVLSKYRERFLLCIKNNPGIAPGVKITTD